MKLLEGKAAVVTGAGSGFGREMSVIYAKEGASVVVSDINVESGEETAHLISKEGGKAVFLHADVSNPHDCEELVVTAVREFGKLDVAFNNAGVGGGAHPIAEYPVDDWDRVIKINLSSVFYCMKFEIAQMLKGKTGGTIVNMASVLGTVGFGGSAAYVAAKHGVVGLTKNVAIEYGKRGIRANAVCPGFVETNLTHTLMEERTCYDFLVAKHPMGRLGKVREVVDLVLWLSSDRSSFCNGAHYLVDGGYTSK